VAEVRSPDYRAPTLFLYDTLPGGVGLGEALFFGEEEVLAAGLERVERCRCRWGCPGCVGPVRSGGTRDKDVARGLLAYLLGRAVRPETSEDIVSRGRS
jgi:DEAD/DEAH box helicase domain-containing protein